MKRAGVLGGALLCAAACTSRPAPAPAAKVEVAPRFVPSPAPHDVATRCADVGTRRVCWTAAGPRLVPRPVPDAPHVGAWRCSGAGAARVCEDRALGAGSFECGDTLCTQRFARVPDDGQWECADLDGAVLCHFMAPASGIVAGGADPAFFCGQRRGKPGERVCVDFAPDLPAPDFRHCRFDHSGGDVARLCEKGGRRALGGECGAGCPPGAACAGGACLPLEPAPDCWLDADCAGGERCAFGTCRRAP